MMNDHLQAQPEKTWWAPVWRGLVVDAEARHYRRMKNAVWLYLYLLVHANRRTGVLMRKIRTICADMGVNRDSVIRWLNVLRKQGYIVTVNTGRYLTIEITNWKPLPRQGPIQPQAAESSNPRCEKSPTPLRAGRGTILRSF